MPPAGWSGVSADLGVSGDSGVSGVSEDSGVSESLEPSEDLEASGVFGGVSGVAAASVRVAGSASVPVVASVTASKAGRAWCHGASLVPELGSAAPASVPAPAPAPAPVPAPVPAPGSAVFAGPLVGCWLAEPWEALRVRRGVVARGVVSVPVSGLVPAPASGAGVAVAVAVRWAAEPSLALRVRRAGRSPAARGVRAGRDGAGGSWPFRGPHSFGSGTPGGSMVRRFGPPCSDSPGSFAPGHAFATRAASTKSLRSGWPSKPSGSSSGTRCGWPSKPMPNISCVSRSCQAAPA